MTEGAEIPGLATGLRGSGLDKGTLGTLACPLGPIVVQRFLRPLPGYLPTGRRILHLGGWPVTLSGIRRLRVWRTRLSAATRRRTHPLTYIANPPTSASRLRDAAARKGTA